MILYMSTEEAIEGLRKAKPGTEYYCECLRIVLEAARRDRSVREELKKEKNAILEALKQENTRLAEEITKLRETVEQIEREVRPWESKQ